ncbi:hypothetical protein ACTXT7_010518 [Hymenolepis weldensis]
MHHNRSEQPQVEWTGSKINRYAKERNYGRGNARFSTEMLINPASCVIIQAVIPSRAARTRMKPSRLKVDPSSET